MAGVMEIATVALGAEMRRIEAVAHNIANASTPGFKRQLDGALAAAGVSLTSSTNAVTVAAGTGLLTDLSAGRLTKTDEPLNLAITGPGFFTVRTGGALAYTRNGAFTRDVEGKLVNSDGGVLQGDGGDIVVGPDTFRVELDGAVVQELQPVDRLRIVQFPDAAALSRTNGGAFKADERNGVRVDDPVVRQGYLEMGNVDLGHEMVRMMEGMRRFELSQKLIQAHEDMIGGAVRRLGDLQS